MELVHRWKLCGSGLRNEGKEGLRNEEKEDL
jgi:hypothetical protein